MSYFTTRPEIVGRFGVVASTHWIASAVGMSMLERGGNAFDAAVAMGFVLQVVEPHLNGLGGDMPAILYSAREDSAAVICGQGTAPAQATIERYRAQGFETIPGSGLLATVIPGAFDGWMRLLRDYGRLSLEEVLTPAIVYAEKGHPILPSVCKTIEEVAPLFLSEWPTSAAIWLPDGKSPVPQSNFKNPMLADTLKLLLKESKTGRGRERDIDAARRAFYSGPIAEKIDNFVRNAELWDESGERHKGLLTGSDLANWKATVERPCSFDYGEWTLLKTNAWGQGPVLLQSLALLKGMNIGAMDPVGPEFIHTVTEAMKLAYADREVYYGDPNFVDVPLEMLLSEEYNTLRRKLIGRNASAELLPGLIEGYQDQVRNTCDLLKAEARHGGAVYEPTMSHLSKKQGDTCHIDAIDSEGNMISATPSGGWLQSSPAIPELGFCLNTRAQMFWLVPGVASSLAPGKRPRTTLTPSLALRDGRPELAFGSPGGDQQDQWQLIFFLRFVHHQRNMQANIDLPLFHTTHFPSSFAPRTMEPAGLAVEESVGEDTLKALSALGHKIDRMPPWTIGRLTATRRTEDGTLFAAATPRLMQAYAIGR